MPPKKHHDDCDLDPAVAEEARKVRELGFVDDDGNCVLDSTGKVRPPWNKTTERKRRARCYRKNTPTLPTVPLLSIMDNPLPDKWSTLNDCPDVTWESVIAKKKRHDQKGSDKPA